MVADETNTTPVQERVRQQVADELTANRKEQEELTGQIAALTQRLKQLQSDEQWLMLAQSSLPATPAEDEPEAGAPGAAEPAVPAEDSTDAAQTVPAQRQDQAVKRAARATKSSAKKTTAGKKATGKKAATSKAKKSAAKKPSGEQAAAPESTAAPADKAAADGKSGPLWELLLGVLRKTPGQPLVAREVSDQLAEEHPGRATSAQTVRNGLETLVKKNLAEKSRQQGNVMYTAYTDTPATLSSPVADEPAGGEAEKVPAEV